MSDFVREVSENWSQIDADASLERQSLGATNHVFRIQSSEAFYLRKYRARNVAQITLEHELLQKLSQNLNIIIAPVLSRDGCSFCKIGEDFYALFPEAKGALIEKSELSELHAFQLGKALADLHVQLASVVGNDFPTIELSWDKSTWVDRLQKIVAVIEASSEFNSNGMVLRRAKQQRDYLASSKAIHSYTPLTTKQLIHGDFHHFNVFFDSHCAVSDVIDWDLVQNMPPGYEVARACMYMFNMEPNKSLALLKGYLSVNPLSRLELNDGAKAWSVYADHHVWALEEVFLKNNTAAQKFIPQSDFIPFMEQWSKIESALFCGGT
ncbi:phosphotransferase enzyme family protein [Photobacterium halotolerans]|uniref:phosphotransferase enzyme family protein n=1 Tax=Photobacterium halotolerans TaxID=265726 RepID=UPI00137242E5|nr:phosphotransferase [Photobacterium halotolerans]NAW86632.1 phosphotransferase [Photobacterium halotolerans]NAX46573.1 phosphotransferase [Photobacterium halotolerans]